MKKSIVFHIPHCSTVIPEAEAKLLVAREADLSAEILRLTDWHTDELFDLGDRGIGRVVYPVSRLVVDPERFRDDARELMAANGTGAIYMMTSDGKKLRENVSPAERDRLLAEYYDPHHAAVKRMVGDALRQSDHCLIVDCHSFPSRPLGCDVDQDADRPDFCIGKDWFHTPNHLVSAASETLQAHGWRVAVNKPYAGAFVPRAFYRYEWRVSSIMIEINRRLYMDELTGAKLPGYENFRRQFQTCLRKIITVARETWS
ncbi:N-formylglutamate amidohydrolase [bacterium]|nr:N-formylglutamate amidohydrolase [bacterium]